MKIIQKINLLLEYKRNRLKTRIELNDHLGAFIIQTEINLLENLLIDIEE